MHRMTECGAGTAIWEWTKERIAWILRTDPSPIPQEWILRPSSRYGRHKDTGKCYVYARIWCGSGCGSVVSRPRRNTMISCAGRD
jgi:hypothetical protein